MLTESGFSLVVFSIQRRRSWLQLDQSKENDCTRQTDCSAYAYLPRRDIQLSRLSQRPPWWPLSLSR